MWSEWQKYRLDDSSIVISLTRYHRADCHWYDLTEMVSPCWLLLIWSDCTVSPGWLFLLLYVVWLALYRLSDCYWYDLFNIVLPAWLLLMWSNCEYHLAECYWCGLFDKESPGWLLLCLTWWLLWLTVTYVVWLVRYHVDVCHWCGPSDKVRSISGLTITGVVVWLFLMWSVWLNIIWLTGLTDTVSPGWLALIRPYVGVGNFLFLLVFIRVRICTR